MTFPSDEFKRKLLKPIEDLFRDAMEGIQPTDAGGRNYQRMEPPGKMLSSFSPPKPARPSRKLKTGSVDEAALREAMIELNSMIGLSSVKRSINRLTKFARIESERRRLKLPSSDIRFHCVFSGSPGTGKTSVARLLGRILKALGLVENGHTVEVSKAGLCGQYLGQTPHMVQQAFDEADGGVLFIDEAYALNRGEDDLYGGEAIDAIVKLMEDRRDRVVVIVAGYHAEMRTFIRSNPGLRSRFSRNVFFPDYTAEELHAILKQHCLSRGFEPTQGFLLRSELLWQSLVKRGLTSEGNGRLVSNAFDHILENQAIRLSKLEKVQAHELCHLLPEDWEHVEELIKENQHD